MPRRERPGGETDEAGQRRRNQQGMEAQLFHPGGMATHAIGIPLKKSSPGSGAGMQTTNPTPSISATRSLAHRSLSPRSPTHRLPASASAVTAGTTYTTAVQPRKPHGSGLGEWRIHERPLLPAGPVDARFRSRSPWRHSGAAGCPRSAAASAPPGSGTPASDQRDPGGRHHFPALPRPARGRC